MEGSLPARLGPAGVVMQFGPVIRGGAVLLLTAAAVGWIVLSLRQRGGDALAPKLFLGVIVLMLAAGAVEVLGVAHRLVPGGIERVEPWRRRTLVRWSDVVSLQWSGTVRWYEVQARSGERVRVYRQLTGMPAFARAVLEEVPPSVVDAQPGLRQRLELVMRGAEPPDEPEREEWKAR